MDRIHDHQIDEALRRVLTEPSHAARYATAIADQLGGTARHDQPVGCHLLPVMKDTFPSVLGELPDAIRSRAGHAVYGALPELRDDETCGEYAIRLRDAAKGL